MKTFKKTIITVFLVMLANFSFSQVLMNNIEDAQKLKLNEQLFIDKPLKTLLKLIKPKIKMVSASPSLSNQTRLGYIIFRFVEHSKYDSIRRSGKTPMQIVVFVKEPFEWDIQKRKEKEKFLWTPSDEETLNNLTIVGLRVYSKLN